MDLQDGADELEFIGRVRFARHEPKRILVSHETDIDIDFIQHVSILEENIRMNATNHVDGGASVRKRARFCNP